MESTQFENSKNVGDGFVYSVIEAWQMMNNQMDWEAIGPIGEILGIFDYEEFIKCLLAIRKFNSDRANVTS